MVDGSWGINVTFDSTDPNEDPDNPSWAFIGDVAEGAVGMGYTIVLDAKDEG